MLKILQQNIDVLAGGDAAEQNNFAFRAQFFCKTLRIPRERFPVTRIAFMDIDFGKFAQIAQTYSGRGIDQATRRRNYEDAANSLGRAGEGIGVGKFATKIKSAQKGKDFTQSRAFAAAQSSGEVELRARAQNHARAFATCVSRRKQKYAVGFDLFHAELPAEKMRARRQSTHRLHAPRLDGVSPYQSVLAKISLVGQRSAEPQTREKPLVVAAPVAGIGPRWLRPCIQNSKFII